MKKEFEITEDFIKRGYIHCKTLEEYKDMVNWFISNKISISDDLKYVKDGVYCVYCTGEVLHNCKLYLKSEDSFLIEWSDYMKSKDIKEKPNDFTMEVPPENKKQYTLIELSDLPNGSKLYFERLNSKIHVYIDNNGILKYEDDNKPLSPSKDNLKATFTLVSLPSKEVSFKEAVEHYSKGGIIQSELNGENKTYKGLNFENSQKRCLISYEGLCETVDEILNAKWYIIE